PGKYPVQIMVKDTHGVVFISPRYSVEVFSVYEVPEGLILEKGARYILIGDGRGDGKKRIYAAGVDNRLYEIEWENGWKYTVIGTCRDSIHGMDIGDARGDGKKRVYVASHDSCVYEFAWTGKGWRGKAIAKGNYPFYRVVIAGNCLLATDCMTGSGFEGCPRGNLWEIKYAEERWEKKRIALACTLEPWPGEVAIREYYFNPHSLINNGSGKVYLHTCHEGMEGFFPGPFIILTRKDKKWEIKRKNYSSGTLSHLTIESNRIYTIEVIRTYDRGHYIVGEIKEYRAHGRGISIDSVCEPRGIKVENGNIYVACADSIFEYQWNSKNWEHGTLKFKLLNDRLRCFTVGDVKGKEAIYAGGDRGIYEFNLMEEEK
ncbi:hypothetical protein DRQ20_06880, partial [bacterium]